MKYVKKILRLLPFFILLYTAIFCIFSKNEELLASPVSDTLDLMVNFIGSNSLSFGGLFNSPIISGIIDWFSTYISGESLFITFSIIIMFYELILSLVFLCFDFINMVFDWSNKFIKKGSDLD